MIWPENLGGFDVIFVETTHSSDAWNPAVHAQFINVYSPFLSHVQDFSAGNRIHYKTDDIMDPLHHYMHFYPTPAEHAASKSSPTSSSYQARKPLNVPSNSCLKGTVDASRSIEVLLNSAPLWKNGRPGAQTPPESTEFSDVPPERFQRVFNISQLQRDLWSESCRGQQLASDFKFEVGGWKGLGRLGKTLIWGLLNWEMLEVERVRSRFGDRSEPRCWLNLLMTHRFTMSHEG